MEPFESAEQRESAWDKFVERLPVCSCCGHSVYPGDRFYENRNIIVCEDCKVDLDESERILEER